MSIYFGSRYETAVIEMITDASGNQNIVAFRSGSPLAAPTDFSLYTTKPGDRIDTLAYRFYQREDYFWLIADANPEIAMYPLAPGINLRIPSVVG